MQSILSELQVKNKYLAVLEISGILKLILDTPNLTNSELVRLTGVPKETLKQFKKSISSHLEVVSGDTIVFTSEARDLFEKLDLASKKWTILEYSDLALEQQLNAIRAKYYLIPKREYDQFFATSKTSIAKAKILIDKGVADGTRIAFLGDDDLVSVTLGLLSPHYESITVFDVDPGLLTAIETICRDLGIKNVSTVLYDARTELPAKYLGNFDVVMTDPPYTANGISLFIAKALALGCKTLFLFYGNSFKSPEKTLKVQEIISSFNLVVEDKIAKFARYYGAESVGSASSLYILKPTDFTTIAQQIDQETIYTFEDRTEDKFPFVDHFTFKIYNVADEIVNSRAQLQKILGELCKQHKIKVLKTEVTQFKGLGLTFTFVLANSNMNVHTWPEFNCVHIDLITCSPIYNKAFLTATLSRLFRTKHIETRKIE